MKCLDCGNEMQQGITSDEEKKKKGLKGFFTKEIISISTDNMEHCAWYCSKCKKVLMWMDTDE